MASPAAPFSTVQVDTLAKAAAGFSYLDQAVLNPCLRNQAEQEGWKFSSPAQGSPKEKSLAVVIFGQEKPD